MTVAICLNFGDRIYFASDSLVTTRLDNGKLRFKDYCLKTYALRGINAAMAFAGSAESAKDALAKISRYTESHIKLAEEELFNEVPQILNEACKNWKPDSKYDLEIVFAGLTPRSKAYENEKYPGLGVPPKTVCGVFSVTGNPRSVEVKKGTAIHVPSNPEIKMEPSNPLVLMDAFVIGSGSREIKSPQVYYSYKYDPPEFIVQVLPREIQSYFEKIPVEDVGIGGAYEVVLITEDGIKLWFVDPRERIRGVTVKSVSGAVFVIDNETGQREILKTIWDDRLPFNFDETECLFL